MNLVIQIKRSCFVVYIMYGVFYLACFWSTSITCYCCVMAGEMLSKIDGCKSRSQNLVGDADYRARYSAERCAIYWIQASSFFSLAA